MNATPVIPGLGMGQIPTIGMVAAPTSGGHVGIGIGIMPSGGQLMSPSPSVPQPSVRHGFASPDTSSALSRSPPPGHGDAMVPNTWPFFTGLGYPLLGITTPSYFGDSTVYPGLNFLNGPHPIVNQGTPDLPLTSFPSHSLVTTATGISTIDTNPRAIPSKDKTVTGPVKEIIHCKFCTLFPPNPGAPPPTTREKPNGCRTVFVGGLPENITEEIVRGAFEHCGEISTVRMSKKNFCHIRFQNETYVEEAIGLSGYRIRIGSNSDAANLGQLHVDYAQARDDFYEWECCQRQLQREQRHRDRFEQEHILPPSPPQTVHFSDHEAATLAENIKVTEQFGKSVQILTTWLERGDCCRRNSSMFYSMVQSSNSHVKRLLNEKCQYEEELQRTKELAKQRLHGVSIQFSQVEKVFVAASHKKVWDHFTKPQRKNIDTWRKAFEEVLSTLNVKEYDREDEMEFSDDSEKYDSDQPDAKKRRGAGDTSHKSIDQLQEENDSLRCQLEAFKNEVDLIKTDYKQEIERRDTQIKTLQIQEQIPWSTNSGTTISLGVPNQFSPTQSHTTYKTSVQYQSNREEQFLENQNLSEVTRLETNCDSSSTTNQLNLTSNSITSSSNNSISSTSSTTIESVDARIIAIISTFLNVHPFGVSLCYISSFVQKILPTIKVEQIQTLLLQYPGIFKLESTGLGTNLETKWRFVGFSE